MASKKHVFEEWLSEKLKSLELDTDIYVDYFCSVLDETKTDIEVKELLQDILEGVLESDHGAIANEIIEAWKSSRENTEYEKGNKGNAIETSTDKIKHIIEKQQAQVNRNVIKKQNGDTELKQKMLASYGEVSDEEEDGSDNDAAPSSFVNTNAKDVTDKQQEMREKQKKASEEKKLRDKLNREKEKAKKDERAEKEKKRTQKGERRR